MKFGVREICNVVFRAKAPLKIGSATFKKGQPVFFMDSAKTSTLESASTSVYATGGRGNTRLVTWEGEKTLTFTVEDALISPISFAMLSGAGVVKGKKGSADEVHVHTTTNINVGEAGKVDLSDVLGANEKICSTAPIFVMGIEEGDGSLTGELYTATLAENVLTITGPEVPAAGTTVMVDYYVLKKAANVTELQIDAEKFAGQFYVEADTLFRAQKDGQDYPANITLPNIKIQSNWTFTMASSGDPSTFTFTMDAMPGYTYFDNTKKVLCVIQVIEDTNASEEDVKTVMGHASTEKIESGRGDSVTTEAETTAKTEATTGYTAVGESAYSATTEYYIYDEMTESMSNLGKLSQNDFDELKASLYTKD